MKQSEFEIPGLPEAEAEAKQGQAAPEGQRLTLQAQAPLGVLDAGRILAGPLFRGTDAAPQVELFGKGEKP